MRKIALLNFRQSLEKRAAWCCSGQIILRARKGQVTQQSQIFFSFTRSNLLFFPFFSTYLSKFVEQGELKLDASSRPTRIASVCLRLILHCTIVHTSVVRHSVYSRFGQIQTPLCQGSASPRWGEGAAGHAGTCDTNGQRYVDGQSYFS